MKINNLSWIFAPIFLLFKNCVFSISFRFSYSFIYHCYYTANVKLKYLINKLYIIALFLQYLYFIFHPQRSDGSFLVLQFYIYMYITNIFLKQFLIQKYRSNLFIFTFFWYQILSWWLCILNNVLFSYFFTNVIKWLIIATTRINFYYSLIYCGYFPIIIIFIIEAIYILIIINLISLKRVSGPEKTVLLLPLNVFLIFDIQKYIQYNNILSYCCLHKLDVTNFILNFQFQKIIIFYVSLKYYYKNVMGHY